MKHKLSKRLLACCDFVKNGDRVADIGCDHGYLGIYLLDNGIAASVIAADINQGPLDSALKNAHKYQVADKMRFYLSDGVKNIPKGFDVLVCAGMGGDTIISILENARWLCNGQYRLILQCQSKTPALRQYLSENGWYIQNETVLRDGRFLYTVMEVIWNPEESPLSVGQYYICPALLRSGSPYLEEFYQDTIFRLKRAITGQRENANPMLIAALKELESTKI